MINAKSFRGVAAILSSVSSLALGTFATPQTSQASVLEQLSLPPIPASTSDTQPSLSFSYPMPGVLVAISREAGSTRLISKAPHLKYDFDRNLPYVVDQIFFMPRPANIPELPSPGRASDALRDNMVFIGADDAQFLLCIQAKLELDRSNPKGLHEGSYIYQCVINPCDGSIVFEQHSRTQIPEADKAKFQIANFYESGSGQRWRLLEGEATYSNRRHETPGARYSDYVTDLASGIRRFGTIRQLGYITDPICCSHGILILRSGLVADANPEHGYQMLDFNKVHEPDLFRDLDFSFKPSDLKKP